MGRAPCCDKANVKKGPWSPEEDAMLQSYIHKHGTGGNWIALPHKIGLKRCGKSCRLRWLNYLRPNIKHGGFSEEEDRIICNLFVSIGSRWSIIAAQLPGRTDNDIKNYWNTRLKKRLLGRRRDNDSGCKPNLHQTSAQTLTSSAIERLQLHMRLQGLHDPFSFYPSTATQSSTSVSPMKHSPETNTSSSFSSTHHAGLHDLVYGKENHFFADMDRFKEMNDFEEGINWWTDYSMLQEFEI